MLPYVIMVVSQGGRNSIMVFVFLGIAVVAMFVCGYFLLDHLRGFMKTVFRDTYGDDQPIKGKKMVVSEDEELQEKGQFAYDDLLEEAEPQK